MEVEVTVDFEDILVSSPLSAAEYALHGRTNIMRGIELLNVFGCSAKNNLGYSLYHTRAHVGIYDILLDHAHSLSGNKYFRRLGECSATLVGAKGIGKTSSLKAFVQLCPRVVPNLFTIYVNYNNVITSGQEFRLSLISIVILRLRLLDVPIPECREQEKSPKDNLLGFLLSNKLKVLILVDELDQLYKNCDDVSLHTLHDLAALGNQPTGTISVLVCGSSAMMEALITCNADVNVRLEFPLLNKGAPNLNGTKYLTKRVYTTLPTDLDAVASMTGTETSAANKPWLRFVAFAGGCSARATGRILADSSVSGALLRGLSPDAALSGHNTLATSDLCHLRAGILAKIYEKNENLMNDLFDAGTCVLNMNNIATVPWEDRFESLSFEEVRDVWKLLIKNKAVPEDNSDNLVYNLYHLSDRCWLTLSGVSSSAPQVIYPYSLFHLIRPAISAELLPSEQDKLMAAIRAGAGNLAAYLSNPRVVASAVVVAPAVAPCCVVM